MTRSCRPHPTCNSTAPMTDSLISLPRINCFEESEKSGDAGMRRPHSVLLFRILFILRCSPEQPYFVRSFSGEFKNEPATIRGEPQGAPKFCYILRCWTIFDNVDFFWSLKIHLCDTAKLEVSLPPTRTQTSLD